MDPTLQLIINVGAIATALAAIVGFFVTLTKIWPHIKRAVAVMSQLEKLPEMAAEITTQSGTLDSLTTEVRTVKQQVQNSHVTNLRDDVDEVIGKIDTFHDKLDDHLRNCPTPTAAIVNINPGSAT